MGLRKVINKLLTWLDGYDRNLDVYTRAVSPKDNWMIGMVILVLLIFKVIVIALVFILVLKGS